jgi:hypothetical protein
MISSDGVTAGTGLPDKILRRELGQIGDFVFPEVLKIFAMTPSDRKTRTRSIRWS